LKTCLPTQPNALILQKKYQNQKKKNISVSKNGNELLCLLANHDCDIKYSTEQQQPKLIN